MGHHHLNIEQEHYKVPEKAKRFTWILIVVGLVLATIGVFTIPRGEEHGNDEGHHASVTETTILQAGANEPIVESPQEEEGLVPAVEPDAAHEPEHHAEASHGHTNDAQNPQEDGMHSPAVGGTPIDCGIVGCDNPAHSHVHAAHGNHHEKKWYVRIYLSLLMNGYYILLISLGGLFFYCVQYISNAGWATTLLRIPQGMYSFFIIPAVLVMVVVAVGGKDIYHWIEYQSHNYTIKDVGNFDPILHGKKWFLNKPFLFGVVPACILIWYIIGMRLKTLANKEDAEGGTWFHSKSIRNSAKFMVLFGFTFSFLAWLVIMSIDAHWYSTIFGIYHFAILWVTALSTIMLFTLHLRKNGYIKILKDDHIHDLSKFIFAFCVFWMYIWIAQYLLIWYANIPEEAMYYTMRRFSAYDVFFIGNVIINFILPFLLFMSRDGKRNPKIIIFVTLAIIIGHWNDLYLSIYPGAYDGKVVYPGLLEIGVFILFAGIFIKWTLWAISKRGLIPINHPFIEESATHDVGV